MRHDTKITLQELKQEITDFRVEREWTQYSDPYDIAAAISIEASELLELFLWKKPAEVQALFAENGAFVERVSEEIADIMAFCLVFSHATGIDLSNAITEKMKKNAIKYPVDEVKGNRRAIDKSARK